MSNKKPPTVGSYHYVQDNSWQVFWNDPSGGFNPFLGPLRILLSDQQAAQNVRAAPIFVSKLLTSGYGSGVLAEFVLKSLQERGTTLPNWLAKAVRDGKLPWWFTAGFVAYQLNRFLKYLNHKWEVHVKPHPEQYWGSGPRGKDIRKSFFWDSDATGRPVFPDGTLVPEGKCHGVLFNRRAGLWYNYPTLAEDAGLDRGFTTVGLSYFNFLKIEGTMGWEYPATAVWQTIKHYMGVRSWNAPLKARSDDGGESEQMYRYTIFRGLNNTAFFLHMESDGHVVINRTMQMYRQVTKRKYAQIVMFLDHQLEKTHNKVLLCKADGKKSLNAYAKQFNADLEAGKVKWGHAGWAEKKLKLSDGTLLRMASGIAYNADCALDLDTPVPAGQEIWAPGNHWVTSDEFNTIEMIAEKFNVTPEMIQVANPKNINFNVKPYCKNPKKSLPTGIKLLLPLGQLIKMTTAYERFEKNMVVETWGARDKHDNGAWLYPRNEDATGEVTPVPWSATEKNAEKFDVFCWWYTQIDRYDKNFPKGRPYDGNPANRVYMDPVFMSWRNGEWWTGGVVDSPQVESTKVLMPDQAFRISPLEGLQDASSHLKALLSYYTHGAIHFWANGTAQVDKRIWSLAPLATQTTQWMNGQAVFLSWLFIGNTLGVMGSILVFNNSNPVGLHHGAKGIVDVFTIGAETSEFHRMSVVARTRVRDYIQAKCRTLGQAAPEALQHNLPLTDAIIAGTTWHAADHYFINNCFSQDGNIHATKSDMTGLFYSLVKPIKYFSRPYNLVRWHVSNSWFQKVARFPFRWTTADEPISRILWDEAAAVNLDFAENALSVGCAF